MTTSVAGIGAGGVLQAPATNQDDSSAQSSMSAFSPPVASRSTGAAPAAPGSSLSGFADLFANHSAERSRSAYLAHVKLPPLDSSLDDEEDA